MNEHLFAYGSLKTGFAPPEIAKTVEKLKYAGDGFVYGRLYDLGAYSGAVLGNAANGKIYGVVYEIPSEVDVLEVLDEYEGIVPHQPESSLFIRKRTAIFLESGEKIDGWIYVYNRTTESAPLIENGIWNPK